MPEPLPPAGGRRLRGLWLARELPFPLDSGDHIYTAHLVRALADAGCDLRYVGFGYEDGTPPADWPLEFQRIPGAPRSKWLSLFSLQPLVTAGHATPAYRAEVERLAREDWDFVAFDQYAMVWAIELLRRARGKAQRPVLLKIAHDHEASLSKLLWQRFEGSAFKRAVLWQNHLKIRAAERRAARQVDLLATITAEDAAHFAKDAPGTPSVVLTPGYCGPVVEQAAPRATLERRVVLVGSFRWLVKQQNLQAFLAVADPLFARHGITLDVVGSMPEALAAALRSKLRATVLHGFVDDTRPLLAGARIAVVPEAIGGGFKLKFLDYLFGRVPIASLTQATAGLSEALKQQMICRRELPGLALAIVEAIDQTDRLDAMQAKAHEIAHRQFRWEDRGQALLAALRERLRPGADAAVPDATWLTPATPPQ